MTTGHLNPGYERVVTRFKSALDNSSGKRVYPRFDKSELETIKAQARRVWSAKDTSDTTYGHFFSEPTTTDISKAAPRPTSPTRRNNPHPSLAFMAARLRSLPGYYDANAVLYPNNNEQQKVDVLRPSEYENQLVRCTGSTRAVRSPSCSVYSSAHQYINSLPCEDIEGAKQTLQSAGIDVNAIPLSPQQNTAVINHFSYKNKNPRSQSTFISSFVNEPGAASTTHQASLKKCELQSNATNPFLYNDMRIYREKYALNNHGMPNPDAKRPNRGDFSMHPKWHPRLHHHRLPCLC